MSLEYRNVTTTPVKVDTGRRTQGSVKVFARLNHVVPNGYKTAILEVCPDDKFAQKNTRSLYLTELEEHHLYVSAMLPPGGIINLDPDPTGLIQDADIELVTTWLAQVIGESISVQPIVGPIAKLPICCDMTGFGVPQQVSTAKVRISWGAMIISNATGMADLHAQIIYKSMQGMSLMQEPEVFFIRLSPNPMCALVGSIDYVRIDAL